ncbi:MAG TPA: transporter [Phycisphaerales bacterium]|nr:transporter [Phycisphaerales bacterium]HRQ75974.1 transporter [Phycisphaerales bacterium]
MSLTTLRAVLFAAACAMCFAGESAHAQEPINSPAATQPSTGRWVVRQQVKYLEARRHPITGDDDFSKVVSWTNIAYGVAHNFSMNLSIPIEHERYRDASGARHRDTGLADVTLMGKLRLWQHDFGPIDTSRFSLLAGVEIPTYDHPFSSRGANPIIGGVFTHVHGRHGVNLSGRYKFNTGRGTKFNLGGGRGKADALLYDASYLYRLAPAQYDADTLGAWYGVVELNGIYETNGDNELFIAPGIMYEARTWTIEAAVQIPAWQDLDRRGKTRFIATLGVRLLF